MVSERQTAATLVLVSTGVMLAVLLAAWAARSIPERGTTVVSGASISSINYKALKQGANLAELERGRVYYVQLCVACHGVRGDGYGEWAYRVTPQPRDLTSAGVQSRSDAYLFSVISDGLIGSAMTGWKKRLSERQRWQLVAFVRHLGAQQMQTGTGS